MVPYLRSPDRTIRIDDLDVASFVAPDGGGLNADRETVSSFGEEWNRFATFTEAETRVAGDEVFDLVTREIANDSTVALDIGCGTGRWSLYLAPRVKFIEAVDPGDAIRAAARLTRRAGNIRVTQAGYGGLPFAPGSFDLVFSLGVVHHLPDTEQAIREAASMVKPGGWLLLYIYYAFDNRGWLFRSLFPVADAGRRVVSRMPASLKFVVCDLLAASVYLPLVGLARLARGAGIKHWSRLPLSYYVGKPWKLIRNDSLDRFGTPLEKRFSRDAIHGMLERAGLTRVQFSDGQPFWHVVAQR